MTQDLQIFKNPEFGSIRVLEKDGEPWWVLKDVCDALDIGNSRMVADRLDEDEKGVSSTDTPGGTQDLTVISESGLYSVILQSRKPEAKKFKRWVTHEVLPCIRRHGGYLTPEKVQEAIMNPDTLIQLATQIKEYRETIQKQTQVIGELKPKADYTDRILKSKGTVTMQQIAKDYGMSATRLNRILRELGVQYKQSGQWLLYSKYHAKGYTHSDTINIIKSDGTPDIRMHTKWTQKGRLFLYNLLKGEGILPVIEQEYPERIAGA